MLNDYTGEQMCSLFFFAGAGRIIKALQETRLTEFYL